MDRMRNIHIHRLFPALSPAEGHLLSIVIGRPQGITVSALSEALDMPMSAVSRMMRSMESRELIRRQIMPQDRRSIIVTVTPKGIDTCTQLHESFHGFFQEILDIFEPAEFEMIIRSWNRIMDRMELVLERQLLQEEPDRGVRQKHTSAKRTPDPQTQIRAAETAEAAVTAEQADDGTPADTAISVDPASAAEVTESIETTEDTQ